MRSRTIRKLRFVAQLVALALIASWAPAALAGGSPPLFSKQFVPDWISNGSYSTLIFTIDNSSSGTERTNLDFTDLLPAGMTVRTTANAATTCTGGSLTAVPETGSISYTGGTVAALSSCTVQADVQVASVGSYVNTSGSLTSSAGDSGTASDTLEAEVVAGGLYFEFPAGFMTNPTRVLAFGAVYGGFDFTQPPGNEIGTAFEVPAFEKLEITDVRFLLDSGCTADSQDWGLRLYDDDGSGRPGRLILDRVSSTCGQSLGTVQVGPQVYALGRMYPCQAPAFVVENFSPDARKVWVTFNGGDCGTGGQTWESCYPTSTVGVPAAFRCGAGTCPAPLNDDAWHLYSETGYFLENCPPSIRVNALEGALAPSATAVFANGFEDAGTRGWSTTAPASCSDGVRNGDETGIDCGGATCASCELSCPAPAAGALGGACATDADCGAGNRCLVGSSTRGPLGPTVYAAEGYCVSGNLYDPAATCASDADCVAGTVCVARGDEAHRICMPACACAGSGCPANQACAASFGSMPLDEAVCVPGKAGAQDGDACAGVADCDPSSACANDAEHPNGQCERTGCTLGDDSTCDGGHCVAAGPGVRAATVCVDTCAVDGDCRAGDGYVCFDPDAGGPEPGFCRHPHVGDACTTSAECGGGAWLCSSGHCTLPCTGDEYVSTCPVSSACSGGACLQVCPGGASDCPAATSCTNVSTIGLGTFLACTPNP